MEAPRAPRVSESLGDSHHDNLRLFSTTKILDRHQARWVEELADYEFKILFRSGKQNVKADYLSRRPRFRLEEGGDGKPRPILRDSNLMREPLPEISSAGEELRYTVSSARLLSILPAWWPNGFLEEVKVASQQDPST